MLLLTTADIIRLVTSSAATLDVHASWVDTPTPRPSGSTDTPGSLPTAIASATTTTVVAAPAAGMRNVRCLIVRNRSAATSVTVTTQLYDGATAYQLDERELGPGQSFQFVDGIGFVQIPTGGPPTKPWYGIMCGAANDGDPGYLFDSLQRGGNVSPTPTQITATVARCQTFMLPFDLTVNRIRAFGVGITASIYRVAIYRMSDLARLTAELPFSTAVDTWVSIGSALNVSLLKDTLYFMACSVNTTGTTVGVAAVGATIAATTGRVNTTPAALPGSLSMGATNYNHGFKFQFAVTAGALPNPAATPAAQAVWTGGMPAFWLDSADT